MDCSSIRKIGAAVFAFAALAASPVRGDVTDVVLPDGYQRIGYVRGDGIAYANLGITLSSDDTVEVEAMVDESVTTPDACVFGSRNSKDNQSFFWTFKGDENAVNATYGLWNDPGGRIFSNDKAISSLFIGKKVLCHLGADRRGFYASDGSVLFSGAEFTNKSTKKFACTDECRLFVANGNISGWATHAFVGRIYSFTVTTNGVPRMNLVPCIKQFEVGFYDTVGGGFYGNSAGSGAFAYDGTVEVVEIPNQVITGEAIEPEVLVLGADENPLVLDRDYTVAYANNVGLGTAVVTVTGKGDYEGWSQVVNFSIVRPPESPVRLTGDFTGKAIRAGGQAEVRHLRVVTADGETLDDSSYVVSYVNNTQDGQATVWAKVIAGEYAGAMDAASFFVSTLPDQYGMAGYVQGDGTAYIDLGITLSSDDTVDVVAMVDESVTTPDACVFGSRNANDSHSFFWTFKGDENAVNATYGLWSDPGGWIFSNDRAISALFIGRKVQCHLGADRRGFYTSDGSVLFSGAEFTNWSVRNFACTDECRLFLANGNISAWATHAFVGRIYSFTVTTNGANRMNLVPCISQGEVGFYDTVGGKFYGNSAGSGAFAYDGTVEVEEIPDQVITGSAVEPEVVVFGANDSPLVLGADYTVAYSNNVGLGTAVATVIGKGDYEGWSKVLNFSIVRPFKSPVRIEGDFTCKAIRSGGQAEVSNLRVVTADGKTLDASCYAVGYVNNTQDGQATVWAKVVAGEYAGAIDAAPFRVCTVPRKYKIVEYVQGDGTAYVNLGIKFSSVDIVEAVAMVDESVETPDGCIFGTRDKINNTCSLFWVFKGDENAVNGSYGYGENPGARIFRSSKEICNLFRGEKVLCHLGADRRGFYRAEDGLVLFSGGEYTNLSAQYFTCADECRLFIGAGDIAAWSPHAFDGRIYSFSVSTREGLRMCLVPCIYEGEVGFYDTVGGGFYGNSAESGSLIAGPTCFNGGFMIRLQ